MCDRMRAFSSLTKAVGPHATSDLLKWEKPAYVDQWEERGEQENGQNRFLHYLDEQ